MCQFHSHPRSLSFPRMAHGLNLHCICVGRCWLLIFSFCLVRFMGWLQWAVPPWPSFCLTSGFRLLTLLPEGGSVHGSCACVSESRDRKWGRLWCHPPPKFTILVMAVNTNFLVGLQRLRKDFYSRTDFDHKSLLFPFHSEEPNLSFAFWHFWGWWS